MGATDSGEIVSLCGENANSDRNGNCNRFYSSMKLLFFFYKNKGNLVRKSRFSQFFLKIHSFYTYCG